MKKQSAQQHVSQASIIWKDREQTHNLHLVMYWKRSLPCMDKPKHNQDGSKVFLNVLYYTVSALEPGNYLTKKTITENIKETGMNES